MRINSTLCVDAERGKEDLPVAIGDGERVTKEQMGSSNVSSGVSGSAERFSQ